MLCHIESYLALPTQVMKANKQRKTPAYFTSNCVFFYPAPQGPDSVNSCAPCVPRICRNLCTCLQSTLPFFHGRVMIEFIFSIVVFKSMHDEKQYTCTLIIKMIFQSTLEILSHPFLNIWRLQMYVKSCSPYGLLFHGEGARSSCFHSD